MKLGHFEIFVRNPEAAITFYRDVLGFSVTVDDGSGMAWLEFDGVEFLLRKGAPPPPENRYEDTRAALVLYTEDLETAARRLKANGLIFKGTVDTEKCLTFTDPDGNWFQLVNPGDF